MITANVSQQAIPDIDISATICAAVSVIMAAIRAMAQLEMTDLVAYAVTDVLLNGVLTECTALADAAGPSPRSAEQHSPG